MKSRSYDDIRTDATSYSYNIEIENKKLTRLGCDFKFISRLRSTNKGKVGTFVGIKYIFAWMYAHWKEFMNRTGHTLLSI